MLRLRSGATSARSTGGTFGAHRPTRGDRPAANRGQATVELALALPLIMLGMLLVIQVGIIVRDQIRTVNAAREGARQAAVDARAGAARQAVLDSTGLASRRTGVGVSERGAVGSRVTVSVTYRAGTDVPLIGPLLPDVALRADATMRVER
ncbi:MAG: TadE family protein [Acidimicrobiales bacterium]